MAASETAADGGVRVTGDVFHPGGEPILSLLVATDEVEVTIPGGNAEGTVMDTAFVTETESLPSPVDGNWAYTATVQSADGREFTLVQSPCTGTLQMVEGEEVERASRIHVRRD